MSNKDITLKDTSSNSLFPKTSMQNVYNSSNQTVASVLATINSKLSDKIEFSENDIPSATPSALDDYYNKAQTDALFTSPTLTSSSVTINNASGTKYVGSHICIESWKSNDGKQWYRKYSDGWKECGYNNFTGSSWALQTWTFPITFSSVNSFAVFNKAVYTGTSTSGNNMTINSYAVYGKTTSSAKIYSDSGWVQDLYACGY